jgi:uncharacterized protein (TIGR02266 family)
MDSTKKILAIITQDPVFEKMEPIFKRASMEVTRATNGTRSLILATNVRYDLVVAEYPLPDLSIVDFLGILQSPTLANSHSPVVLLTKEDHAEDLGAQIDSDRVEVVPISASAEALQRHVAASLGVAQRKSSRLLVQMQLAVETGNLLRACQTSNVSESGMLIHTSRRAPVGSEVEVTFHLPGDPRPIDGVVKVVRHTTPGTETTQGMGVTFVRLPEGARERLRDYVQGRMVIQEEEVLPFSFEQPPAAP